MHSAKVAAAFTLFCCLSALTANGQTTSAGKYNPLVEAKLRVAFAQVDANKDGFLDAAELAKAFRGSKAVPPPDLEYDDVGKPKSGTGFDRKYGDQIYLYALDKDFDGKISWPEFQEYGEAYAAALQGQQLNQQRQQSLYLQAQRNATSSRGRRTTYTRSSRGRITYHRPVRVTQVRVTNTAQRIQAQQIRLMQQQQQRMIQLQLQQQRLQAERMRAMYSRMVASAHRAVKTPPRRR